MNQSEQINELVKALSIAQSQIEKAKKDRKNPFFKSDYATLTSVWQACKDGLTKQGLAVIQTMEPQDGKIILVTTLAHSSGQWIKSYLPVLAAKLDSQSIGSALTYSRRYALAAIVGVCPVDDDGEASVGRTTEEVKKLEMSDKQAKDLIQALEILEDRDAAVEFFRRKYEIYTLTKLDEEAFKYMIGVLNNKIKKQKEMKHAKASVA